jgi:hypothetical protein
MFYTNGRKCAIKKDKELKYKWTSQDRMITIYCKEGVGQVKTAGRLRPVYSQYWYK